MTEVYEVGRAALVTFSTSWRLIYRLVLSWRITKRQSNRSKRERGNTLGWVVWALMSVMVVCLLLWAATGAVALLFGAVLAALGVLYVVLLTNRVHPTRDNNAIRDIRPLVHDAVVEAFSG